ncbi:DUF456 domain-containing protein [Natrinema marinum]|uniref:DUF456 domain-containing protein n=1 Tax=Natrinema marinum TaxID=2961598 RepID=UPI0020C86640|nr:DUF456 domain-containing protein [Natrinema marinum]
MSDRSDEVTESRSRDGSSTDDLLEETDRLLSEVGTGAGDAEPRADAAAATSESGADAEAFGSATERDAGAEADSGSSRFSPSSLLSPLTSRLSLGRYFSPKAFLALVLVVGAGLLAGATVLPIAGRMVGMFAVTFLVGLLASKRRYLEVSAAGVSVGAVSALLTHAVLIAAADSAGTLVAVGGAVGLLASLVGYYFGRDLRDGLTTDID